MAKRKILVTGGTRGLGFSIAEKFLENGDDVTVTGSKGISKGPLGAHYKQVDFSNTEHLQNFIEQIKGLDYSILINNAGINKVVPFLDIDLAEFDLIHNVNLRAPFMISQSVIPGMIKHGWGRIVNIGSIYSVVSKEGRASYSSSKFGLDGLTTSIAAEMAQYGVLINCVSPGFMETEMTIKNIGMDGISEIEQLIPQKRIGNPKEVAEFIFWLCSDLNSYISGQNLIIDGGLSRV